MKSLHLLFVAALAILMSCRTTENSSESALQAVPHSDTTLPHRSADEDVSPTTLIFKNQLCYKYSDELGNTGEYEIVYQPETGMMYVHLGDNIPMLEGVLIYPDATYMVLGENERGKKVSMTFKNGDDLVVELKDEAGVTYPQDRPYINYQLNEGNALVYRDGIRGSSENIKSKLYTITYKRTGDYMTLYLTDAFPQLNARLLYGLAHVPGDVGEFFKRFGELWNISSKQWPTLVSGENYSEEMTCFGATDFHVDTADYPDQKTVVTN